MKENLSTIVFVLFVVGQGSGLNPRLETLSYGDSFLGSIKDSRLPSSTSTRKKTGKPFYCTSHSGFRCPRDYSVSIVSDRTSLYGETMYLGGSLTHFQDSK